jgi:N-acetylmuramic acid 6-phosphate etherase
MLDDLTTEGVNPASVHLDQMNAREIVELINHEDHGIAQAVATQLAPIAKAAEAIADHLRCGGRLVYVGAGTSGRLGVLDAAECPPTFNSDPRQVIGLIAGGPSALVKAVEGAEDQPRFGKQDLEQIGFSAQDIVVGIATSGRTPYVLGALEYAKELGALRIGLTCNPSSDLDNACDILINPVVGPEVLSGSTRMKAGTATKLVLNMLTTTAMVLLGKSYGNLMVDLRASNSKLLQRTVRIVKQITGLSREEAERLLARCDGKLKTAVVVQLRSVSPEEADRLLTSANGRLREALN